jgi:hypothetical protein
MNQQKNLLGSRDGDKIVKLNLSNSTYPRKEKLGPINNVVGSRSSDQFHIKKSNLVGFKTPSLMVNLVYKKSADMIGSVIETTSDLLNPQILKKVENIGMLNSSYFPSPSYNTGIKFKISEFPQPIPPEPETNPTFDSTNVTFDSEIVTFDNSY